MDYADAIRRQAEDAPRAALPAVTTLMWRAFAEGHVTEAEAEALSALIELRQVSSGSGQKLSAPLGVQLAEPLADSLALQGLQKAPRTGVGSRPRTDTSLERRRRWAASGRLPPALAARFTPGEQAALAIVAAETARRGDCRLCIDHMAAAAGISRSTVKAAIREAKKLGLLTVEVRKVAGWRNDTNVVRIVSPEWTAWLRLARKSTPERHPYLRGGVKSSTTTSTQGSKQGKKRTAETLQGQSEALDRPQQGSLRIAGACSRRCAVEGVAPATC